MSNEAAAKMTTKAEIQDLLRFLSQDAKIPLQVTVGKIKMMQDANLTRYIATQDLNRHNSNHFTDPVSHQIIVSL